VQTYNINGSHSCNVNHREVIGQDEVWISIGARRIWLLPTLVSTRCGKAAGNLKRWNCEVRLFLAKLCSVLGDRLGELFFIRLHKVSRLV